MNILYVNDQVFPNPEIDTEQILESVSGWADIGEDVTLLLPGNRGHRGLSAQHLADYYGTGSGFRLKTQPGLLPGPRFLGKMGHALAASLDRSVERADVIFTRNIPTLLSLLVNSSTPVVYETYRAWPDQYPVLGRFFRWLGSRPQCIAAVFHSGYAARSYGEVGFPREKTLVAHNGFNPRRMDPVLTREQARLRLGLPSRETLAVYTGTISTRKGGHILLQLARRMPEVRFLLVGSQGPGPIERLGADLENVDFIPWQSKRDTIPYLYAADILLIPPTLAPLKNIGTTVLPLKTFLYLAAGRAILAPDSPDLREVLVNDSNACLVKPDDLVGAVSALRSLAEDPARREHLGDQARRDARDRTYARRMEKIRGFVIQRLNALRQVG